MGSEIIGIYVSSRTEMAFFFVSGMIVTVPMTLFSGPFTNRLCFFPPSSTPRSARQGSSPLS